MKLDPKYLGKLHSNPFNWTGSKHRYLKDLFEVLPSCKHLTVIDPFVGGGDLISKLPPTWSIFASDGDKNLISMHKDISKGLISIDAINYIIESNNLSSEREANYFKFRNAFNFIEQGSASELYTLICHSNSNRMRFSKKLNEFNMPFGKRTFNKDMQAKLDNYSEALKHLTVNFECKKYSDVDFNSADLLLIDPPYLNTVATYNESGGWNVNDEFELLSKVYKAHSVGVKFVYFGQIWSNGKHNAHLDEWSRQFNVKVLKDTISHCSANRKNGKTIEIMISN